MFARLKKAVLPSVVLMSGVGVFALLQATKPVPEPKVEAPRPTSVHAETAVRSATQLTVQTFGEVRPTVSTEIVAQVGGRIVAVSPEFVEGGRFSPEEPLLMIEDTDYASAVQEAEARVASAQVDVEQALADADVARKQLAGVKDPSPLALRKPQVARARAALEAAETNLALARTNLERTRIALPFTGRITETTVDLGQYVTPGKVVGRAFASDRVEIRLPLNDTQLAALGVPIGYSAPDGQGLPVDFSASVAGQRYYWTGEITRLDASIDPSTRTVYATAQVVDPYEADFSQGEMPMAVGLFVDATVSGRVIDSAVQISADGLRAGNRVFVVGEEGELVIRNVDVIHRSSSQAVLSRGVESGERVVVSAIRNPIPGMRLTVIGDQPLEVTPATDVIAKN
jgi:RND family efflux transporter MFP subunit